MDVKSRTILFLSNGHGVDTVSCHIIKELQRRSRKVEILAFPLVGDGDAYRPHQITLIDPPAGTPCHGFEKNTVKFLLGILRGNLLLTTKEQRKALRSLRHHVDFVIAVGDCFPAFAAAWMRVPFIFVGINKSDYYREPGRRYLPWERHVMRKALMTFVRDEVTLRGLRLKGLTNVTYVGNPMMDFDGMSHETTYTKRTGQVVGLLPGSYQDLYMNMSDLLKVTAMIRALSPYSSGIHFVMAAPPCVTASSVSQPEFPGWTFVPHSNLVEDDVFVGMWTNAEFEVHLWSKHFHEILSSCDVVIGLSGTANEQAAGLGIPVVSFPSRGIQYKKSFARAQHDLLGNALAFIEGDFRSVAQKVINILHSPELHRQMADAGRERMGKPGATQRIAEYILHLCDRPTNGLTAPESCPGQQKV